MAKGWMILVEGMDATKKVHRTQQSAWREMHRLAKLNSGKEIMLLELNRRFMFTEGQKEAVSLGSHLPPDSRGMVDKSELMLREDLKAAKKICGIAINGSGVNTMSSISKRDAEYKPDEVPESVTRMLYIGYGIGKYNAGRIVIDDYGNRDGTDFAVVPLLEKELTIELPRCKVDVKGRMLEVLEDEKQKVIAENHMRLKDVQDRIDQLKCLEYSPTE